MTLNLHELANAPGYGNAEKALRKAGKWDDTAIVEGVTEFEFDVTVKGWYEPQVERQVFSVTAKTKEEAMDKAEYMSDFDEIDDVEIEAVREITQ
jgi:hypothetical protein